jgi:hypothetical protein
MNDREFRQLVTAMRIAQRRYQEIKRYPDSSLLAGDRREAKSRLRDEAKRLLREVDQAIGLLPSERFKPKHS